MRKQFVTLKPAVPATEVITRRRRAALIEAGIAHDELARLLSRGRERPLSRSAITNLLGGHYSSEDFNLERALVDEVQKRLLKMGLPDRAAQMTMDYLGWAEPEVARG